MLHHHFAVLVERKTEIFIPGDADSGLGIVLRNRRRNFHLPLLVVVQYRHRDWLLRAMLYIMGDREFASHFLSIDGDDFVARFQPGKLRRTVLEDGGDFRKARVELYR